MNADFFAITLLQKIVIIKDLLQNSKVNCLKFIGETLLSLIKGGTMTNFFVVKKKPCFF